MNSIEAASVVPDLLRIRFGDLIQDRWFESDQLKRTYKKKRKVKVRMTMMKLEVKQGRIRVHDRREENMFEGRMNHR